jgi:hypothetical protein
MYAVTNFLHDKVSDLFLKFMSQMADSSHSELSIEKICKRKTHRIIDISWYVFLNMVAKILPFWQNKHFTWVVW